MAYAFAVTSLLWPAADVALVRRPGGRTARDWLVLPSPRRPRLLLPAGMPAAARMLERHGTRLLPRAARAVLAGAFRSGVLERLPVARLRVARLPVAASLESILRDVLGEEVVTGVLLGTPRVNRKPVVQVFDRHGRTVAFVKVGHDEMTRGLVRGEKANLEILERSEPRLIERPRVLHFGRLGEAELLVLSPMHSSQEKRAPGPPPVAAMAELAAVVGLSDDPLAGSEFWKRLVSSTDDLPDGELPDELRRTIASVQRDHGGVVLQMGAWHGDWAPWNMGWRNGRVQLWDWERFTADVPLGFDVLHYRAQVVRHNRPGLAAAEDSLIKDLPPLLEEVGVRAASDRASLLLALYLLEVSARYLGTAQATLGAARHPRAAWAVEFAGRLLR